MPPKITIIKRRAQGDDNDSAHDEKKTGSTVIYTAVSEITAAINRYTSSLKRQRGSTNSTSMVALIPETKAVINQVTPSSKRRREARVSDVIGLDEESSIVPTTSSVTSVTPSDLVCFNIGGQIFQTLPSTLANAPIDSFLRLITTTKIPVTRDAIGNIFIDRDGTHFRHGKYAMTVVTVIHVAFFVCS